MTQRWLRLAVLSLLTWSLVLGGGSTVTEVVHSDALVPLLALLGAGPSEASAQPELLSTIAFSSSRDHPDLVLTPANPFLSAEIYLMNPDPDLTKQNPRRLTDNTDRDLFAALSPDGKWVVFDSDRLRTGTEPLNTSDLFVMKNDGKEQTHIARGSSATWSPDSRRIAYHASASGTGLPIINDPGAATTDSDLFVVNVGDLQPMNLTTSPDAIEADPDWSPDGQMIVYIRHPLNPPNPNNVANADLYLQRVDSHGSPVGAPQQLTFSTNPIFTGEERAPSWSPNGEHILYMCRRPARVGAQNFQLCVLDKQKGDNGMWDGTWGVERLLTPSGTHLTATWSPDGTHIVFQRPIGAGQGAFQLFRISLNPDGTCVSPAATPTPTPTATATPTPTATSTALPLPAPCQVTPLTNGTVGLNGWANWGEVRYTGPPLTETPTPTATATPSPTGTLTLTPIATGTPTPTATSPSTPLATSTPNMTPTVTPTAT